jgi:hypothetical protein
MFISHEVVFFGAIVGTGSGGAFRGMGCNKYISFNRRPCDLGISIVNRFSTIFLSPGSDELKKIALQKLVTHVQKFNDLYLVFFPKLTLNFTF